MPTSPTRDTAAADVCFLIAAVLAGLAALTPYRPGYDRHGGALASAAVALVAIGLLLL